MSTTIQRGLFGMDYKPSTSRVSCVDDDEQFVCPCCQEETDRDDGAMSPDDELWCQSCVDSNCTYCARCDELAHDDDCTKVYTRAGSWGRRDTVSWCESCTDTHAVQCDDCGDYEPCDKSYKTAGGSDICSQCYENSYFSCGDCGDIFHCDNAHSGEYDTYCEGCAPADEGDFGPNGFRNRSGRVTEIGSARCYGIEIETDKCDGYYALEDSEAWGAKDDCTVSGKEFYSDILNGDEGLDAVREWGKIADDNDWEAGHCCGLHLHLDLRGDSDDQRFAIAYAYRATEDVWLNFVTDARASGSYSHNIRWNCRDVEYATHNGHSYYGWTGQQGRYDWANCAAFRDHETIEIRLHHGTCDEEEVINWVKAHTRFADWAATKGLEGVKEALAGMDSRDAFKLIVREAWQDEELGKYYNDKSYQHSRCRF